MRLLNIVFLLACLLSTALSFRSPAYSLSKSYKLRSTALKMKGEEIDPDVGYPPIGTLLRQGLVPFVIRIVKPDTYNAGKIVYIAFFKSIKHNNINTYMI